MNIVIPMSGFGERFKQAGYILPKPLIKIEGIPLIAHVINMFSEDDHFTFICNEDHLNNKEFEIESIIKNYAKNATIVSIKPHKLGPVYAVLKQRKYIDINEPVIVNYCDFSCYWDWNYFKKEVLNAGFKGYIAAYKGFHPHSLGTTNYAYIKEKNGLVTDIQEKKPFTKNRMQEYASSGTYYFPSGELMLNAFQATIDQGLKVNGEYYVSLAYRHLIKEKIPICVFPLQHFFQWGTPEDVDDYKKWSSIFRGLVENQEKENTPKGSLIIPMAGFGERFTNKGYMIPKPLISISGRPMVIQAIDDMQPAKNYSFVMRKDMIGNKELIVTLNKKYPNGVIKLVDQPTQGQASSSLIGLEALEKKVGSLCEPITIASCDNGCLYSNSSFQKLFNDKKADIIVWGYRGHPNAMRCPSSFGWIDADSNARISSINVKKPISEDFTEPIVIGTFTFRNANILRECLNSLFRRKGLVNNEYYIDSCINDALKIGYKCFLFEVENYISWGNPDDLKTFEYWQSCFHKWKYHPYSLYKDKKINNNELNKIINKYKSIYI